MAMTTYQKEETWLEGPERLVPQVQQWFRKATDRFAPPSEDGCCLFAQHLHALGPLAIPQSPILGSWR